MRRSPFRWIVGIAIGGIVHIGLFWVIAFLDEPADGPLQSSDAGMQLVYIGQESGDISVVMQQQFELFDPKPLIQPTEWNTANFDRVADYVEADLDIFVDYEPIYESADGDFVSAYGNSWQVAGSPAHTVLQFPFEETSQFGRVDVEREGSVREGIELEIVRIRTGEVVYEYAYYNNAAREVIDLSGTWGIASLVVRIEDSFLVGLPLIHQSSGNAETDERISELVVRELLPKGLLNSGSYQVKISR